MVLTGCSGGGHGSGAKATTSPTEAATTSVPAGADEISGTSFRVDPARMPKSRSAALELLRAVTAGPESFGPGYVRRTPYESDPADWPVLGTDCVWQQQPLPADVLGSLSRYGRLPATGGKSEVHTAATVTLHRTATPALLRGHWKQDLDVSAEGSLYLNELVGLHLATALALVVFFWRDWVRVIGGLFSSVRERRIQTVDQRLAWLLIAATIPVAVAGVALDKVFRTTLGKPVPSAIFLALNRIVLFVTEQLRRGGTGRRRAGVSPAEDEEHLSPDELSDRRITGMTMRQAVSIGAAQILALFPGISRSGSTISAGIFKGLGHEDSARFAFLLATPVIGGALLKLPPLLGPAGNGLRGPLLAGSVAAFIAAYLATRFLVRYFENRTLIPFAVYCSLAGLGRQPGLLHRGMTA
ncbi:undecaprenyl-diphosphate phosphatase [Streptomyces camelliae]|uniref:Undecaprenyl-diphosphatase n=1 Tax=Streptomyces camelliae TaxID=3004093 RepID=A0ABY7PJT9_9ACTN|nr:undecaprenyl-diphosphate phosphatase [Streptomyces sp. HUAS 2-6]WBO68898.1 undecaprenyl-diphosphate phosphatase [Streptomyces sp. HUAS 2-6]